MTQNSETNPLNKDIIPAGEENTFNSENIYDDRIKKGARKDAIKDDADDADQGPCSAICQITGVNFFRLMCEVFGLELIVSQLLGQHFLRGFAGHLTKAASQWLFKEFHTPANTVAIYTAMMTSPYALKAGVGFVLDYFAPGGYHKMPFMISSTVVSLLSFLTICFTSKETISAFSLAVLLTLPFFQFSTCDVCIEAESSKKVKAHPKEGVGMPIFWTGGLLIAGGIGSLMYGPLTDFGKWNPRCAIAACAAASTPILIPSILNWHGEVPSTEQALAAFRQKLYAQKAVVGIVFLICGSVISLLVFNVFVTSVGGRLAASIVMLVFLTIALHLMLRPEIAKPSMYLLLACGCGCTMGPATFYFCTDTVEMYKDGPHMSTMFYNTVCPALGLLFVWVGLGIFIKYMQNWRYTVVLFAACFLNLARAIAMALMTKRVFYPWFPSSDVILYIVSIALGDIAQVWMTVPCWLLIAVYTPKGMEALLFGVLASLGNFGPQFAEYFGSAVMTGLGVTPQGLPHEGAKFDNLWLGYVIQACLILVNFAIVYVFIPSIPMTDAVVVDDPGSATKGSWLAGSSQAANEETDPERQN